MPLYEFECGSCTRITEVYHSVLRAQKTTTCEHCGRVAYKIISKPNIHDDHPTWIDDNLRNAIQSEDEPPIESRTQLRKAEKEKGIVENPKK